MAYETLIVEIEDNVALIRLNRPDALNALNSTLLGELAKALAAADRDDAVRCIIITGSEKAFAAGADIKEMAEKGFVEMFGEDFFAAEAEVRWLGHVAERLAARPRHALALELATEKPRRGRPRAA